MTRKDDNGNTILTSAAQMCGPRIVTRLIAAGADMNAANGGGLTPLGMALIMHRTEVAEVLVTEGARLSAGAGADAERGGDRSPRKGDRRARRAEVAEFDYGRGACRAVSQRARRSYTSGDSSRSKCPVS